MKIVSRLVACGTFAFAVLGAGCGDDPSGPSVTFPQLPASLLAAFCVMGNATAGQNVNGTIAATDCDSVDFDTTTSGAYFEIWRIRVATARTVTFSASSAFDNYLEVYELLSYTSTTVNVTLLDEDDDSGPGLNATVSVALDPGVDYFVVVSGFDYSEVGTYSLAIQ